MNSEAYIWRLPFARSVGRLEAQAPQFVVRGLRIYLDKYCITMLTSVVLISDRTRRTPPSRHVTKIPSPQLLYFPHLQTVTPVTPLESALTQTAGCHSLFLPSFRSLLKERFTSLSLSRSCALFRTFLPFFALAQNATLFFSGTSALFAKNRGCREGAATPSTYLLTSLPAYLDAAKLGGTNHIGAHHV